MQKCKHCGKTFHPQQTFTNLFTRPTACPPCERISKRPLRLERIPLSGSELILFTHDHAPHPVLFKDAFESLVKPDAFIIFHDSIAHAPREAWRALAMTFDPVVVYHPEYPTLDHLERYIEWFESEV